MPSLYIDRKGARVSLDGDALVIHVDDQREGTIPLGPLERVYLRGDVSLSASVLSRLGERGIGVAVVSARRQELTLLLPRAHLDAQRRLRQWDASRDEGFCLAFSQETVRAKIQSQIALLEELRSKRPDQRYELSVRLRNLSGMQASVDGHLVLGTLRGCEGAAAAEYFAGLRLGFAPSLQFANRNRRPPRDPVNALLSLGYTLLHAETVLALHGGGLDPWVGFFHQLDYGRESLACDVAEPLRPIVDRFVWDSFRQRVFDKQDFTASDAACLLSKAARPRFYQAFAECATAIRAALDIAVRLLLSRLQDRPT